nr:unnamed protein product [Spirometra erinaceieuropaei]
MAGVPSSHFRRPLFPQRTVTLVYPGRPPVESQRLIFAGRLISDNDDLNAVFGPNPISRTLHLVATISSAQEAVPGLKTNNKETSPHSDAMSDLRQQYMRYLQQYYQNAAQSNPNGQSTWQLEYMRHISQISAATPAQSVTNSSNPTTPEPDTPVEDQQQVRPRNILQRWARYLGQPDSAEVEGDGLNGQGVAADGADEGFDVVEFAYTLFRSLPTAAEVSQAPTEGHLKRLSLGRLKEVFSTPTASTEQPQENSSAPTAEEDEQDRSYGHLREASRRGDEALPDFASSSSSVDTAPTIAVTPSRLSLSGRTPHLDPHADRHAPDSFVSSPPLSPSPTKELHPRLALAPGPTPSNGQPIMSVGRARRLSASPTADLPPWIDMFDDSESPMMRGSLNAANEASADALADTTADSVPPLRYTSRKYTWSAPPSPVRGSRSSTAPVKETRTDLQHAVSSELPDADSFILPRVPLLASDLNSNSSASSSSNSARPDPARSPVSVAVCSSTSDAISAAPTTATSALFVTYDQAPVFALPSYSIPRPIQPTVRSHRLTRISLPNGRRMVGPGDEAVDPAAATAVLETTNSASPTSFRAAINTPEMVMQILNGTVPDSSPAGRRLPAASSSVFEDRSRVKRRVDRLTDGGEEVEEVGCYSPHRGGTLFGRPALSSAVSNGSLELPQGVLLSRRPPPFVISESEFDEEEEEEDVDGEGYPVEEQLLTQNRFRTHTTLNLKKNARDIENL